MATNHVVRWLGAVDLHFCLCWVTLHSFSCSSSLSCAQRSPTNGYTHLHMYIALQLQSVFYRISLVTHGADLFQPLVVIFHSVTLL